MTLGAYLSAYGLLSTAIAAIGLERKRIKKKKKAVGSTD